MNAINNIHETLNTAIAAAEDKGYNEAMNQTLFWVCQQSGHSPKEYDKYSNWGATFEAALKDLLNK